MCVHTAVVLHALSLRQLTLLRELSVPRNVCTHGSRTSCIVLLSVAMGHNLQRLYRIRANSHTKGNKGNTTIAASVRYALMKMLWHHVYIYIEIFAYLSLYIYISTIHIHYLEVSD